MRSSNAAVTLFFSWQWEVSGTCPSDIPIPPENFTVVIAADVDLSLMADLLKAVALEKPDVVVLNGDIGYNDCNPSAPQLFMNMVDDALGKSLPLFLTKGNHDEYGDNWDRRSGYSELLQARWKQAQNLADFNCQGKWGVNQTCKRQGVAMNFATHGCESCGPAPGCCGSDGWLYACPPERITCNDQCQAGPGFHTNALQNFKGLWRMCFWHKNMHNLQVGGKVDETGYEPYEECLRAGAMIFTGHEHSYERTRSLTSMSKQTVDPEWNSADKLRVKEGTSFVVVGSLGGFNRRPQQRCLPTQYPYGCKGEWAKILSGSHQETTGLGATAVVMRFHVDGNPCKATGNHSYTKSPGRLEPLGHGNRSTATATGTGGTTTDELPGSNIVEAENSSLTSSATGKASAADASHCVAHFLGLLFVFLSLSHHGPS